MPTAHQSAPFPYPFFNITSGAKYSGVPAIDFSYLLAFKMTASP